MRIKTEDIVAYRIDDEKFHAECLSDYERNQLTDDDVIASERIARSNESIYCDRCHGVIEPI